MCLSCGQVRSSCWLVLTTSIVSAFVLLYPGAWAYGDSSVKGGRGVDLPEILHIIFLLLALPRFSPLFCPNLGGQLPSPLSPLPRTPMPRRPIDVMIVSDLSSSQVGHWSQVAGVEGNISGQHSLGGRPLPDVRDYVGDLLNKTLRVVTVVVSNPCTIPFP